jgi:Spy/CpxP family protein refolding chaperone
MRFKVFAVAAALLAVGGAGLVADEQREEQRRTRQARLEAARADIGLTDEQVSEIRRIHGEARKAAIKRNADLRVARLELDELMAAPTLDESKIAARVKAIADLQAAALKERTDSKLAVRKLVTPEQFQKMQQLRRHRFGERGMRPARRSPRRAPEGGGGPGGDGLSFEEPAA